MRPYNNYNFKLNLLLTTLSLYFVKYSEILFNACLLKGIGSQLGNRDWFINKVY